MKKLLVLLGMMMFLSVGVAQQNCGTVKDVEGNIYKTIIIGNQCWMAENMKSTHYSNGKELKMGNRCPSAFETESYWFYPSGKSNNKNEYGLLYTWAAAMGGSASSNRNPSGVQGICPDDWHVPSSSEWKQLIDFIGTQSNFCCGESKEKIARSIATNIQEWLYYRTPCSVGYDPNNNNATGFGARSAGYFHGSISEYSDPYNSFGAGAFFWTSNQRNALVVDLYKIHSFSDQVTLDGKDKNTGLSVRCVRN